MFMAEAATQDDVATHNQLAMLLLALSVIVLAVRAKRKRAEWKFDTGDLVYVQRAG